VVWRADHAFGEAHDIAAHELPGLLLQTAEAGLAGRRARPAQIERVRP